MKLPQGSGTRENPIVMWDDEAEVLTYFIRRMDELYGSATGRWREKIKDFARKFAAKKWGVFPGAHIRTVMRPVPDDNVHFRKMKCDELVSKMLEKMSCWRKWYV